VSSGAIFVAVLAVVAALAAGVVVGRVVSRRQTREQGSVAGADESAHVQAEVDLVRRAAEVAARSESLGAMQSHLDEKVRAQEQAHAEAQSELDGLRAELRELRLDLERREERLATREARLDDELSRMTAREREATEAEAALETRRRQVADLEEQRLQVLERAAGLSKDEAKAELVNALEAAAKRAAAAQIRTIEREATEQAEERARHIVTMAVQRVASDQTAESVVTVLHLPADEMKGRIIGREGRNIRAFEAVTGVNLIIDDTPEAVLLSCFDPVRREVGRLTLESLVLDGRIHPQRIEEVYERSKTEIDKLSIRAAEDALVEVGITDLDPELVRVLGKLRYRTSYGQNVLAHLIETAHLAGMMAAELGLPVALMKRCGFLHDIGKALTPEVEGSHAIIGAELARRHGETPDVVHAIEAHHNEVEVRTLEAVLTQAADAISGGRPGARRESLESYVKRLHRLEEIASEHEGVDRVFAMQAGREVRVMVLPDQIDDIAAQVLARDIAKRVEEELTYPGQIRITVVRESRASELAR
jgi:ribonucrease Y